ncbi:MAG: ERCC4 domain-containing protein [Candidatus Hadarchaeales archaeon]
MDANRIKVIADRRESGSGVLRWLREIADVRLSTIDAGDYVVSDRICIERKSAGDFLQSIVDRRLARQMRDIAKLYEKPVLILEGGDLFSRRSIHPNAIRGALASLVTDLGVSVIPSEGEEDTARIIAALARREQTKDGREPVLRAKPKADGIQKMQKFVVEGLPGISCVLAKRLLKHFGTVERIMRASQEELMKVPGIGKKKAHGIRVVLSSAYRED